MKKAMVDYMQKPKNDELYTPRKAIVPIIPYLKRFKDKVFWECTDFGDSEITKVLRDHSFNVVSTHLKDGLDFLSDDPPPGVDIIITNPPYSLKTEFLERAYTLLGYAFSLFVASDDIRGC